MKLLKVEFEKYKSIEQLQELEIENDVTILVGMNESGKTSILEAIAKSNYFENDDAFKFSTTHDYPRKEKKALDKSKNNPFAIKCTFSIPDELSGSIKAELGENILKSTTIVKTVYYDNTSDYNQIDVDTVKFITTKCKELEINEDALIQKLVSITSQEEFISVIQPYQHEEYFDKLKSLQVYFENGSFEEYIIQKYLESKIPKFLYYDEYYALPSRISIEKLQNNNLEKGDSKTAKALFDLADINITELLQSNDFEDYKAELEATEAIISEVLFKYWKTNTNLEIVFDIDKKIEQKSYGAQIVEHILDIRVKNSRTRVSLPLKNRSKGFNWFFSFLVWFKKIQEDTHSNYILLLDEPGLNLHASAQANLLSFIEDLSDNYQIIYSTHSPFMIPSTKLERVRTVLESKTGTTISESIQEKDPNTLFPLQAALGYDIAQNLFVSQKNLLVEGVSDLVFLQTVSSILESENREFLRDDITIVPTGGLEKVATFISLLRGSNLQIACLLDSFTDAKGKAKLEKLIKNKIIHKSKIRFFDEYLETHSHADLEDLFEKSDYLKLFNLAFEGKHELKLTNLNSGINQIIIQINRALKIDRFNHYLPAITFTKQGVDSKRLSSKTLDNFEKVFMDINSLFK
ncbi:Predicted ATP-dependent endonuclease of the OLD family, contains P-loop ATPase and TOPRIM domains [Tenacibaculum mesophilum]|uniref:AAA family ATPase n=1 Tax=Tenacibaculum mesophilum TaxID=104268 RepID=A0ABN5T3C9_9FLAO|nr:AAA family ATPase [Tenacibaculum mesophilum]AZJ31409.1 AAA family ATPase [Tenacibaculum mesophilum]QFS29456.1 AAA family ATPase [Tenacibaculum mesophilum]SHF96366.1 Predicted ATP-dependent endonuclease of the OLD family, contains P-loop ATPase and TOPRIM domains [Tenacibaculum mesophilum]